MNYKMYKLSNGIKVVCVKTPEFKAIHAQITLRAGSSIETKESHGWSHFVEHMVLQGTKDFPNKDEFDEKVEFLGGGYNGYTSTSKMYFSIDLPDNQLDLGLHYLSDISKNALFREEDFRKEKNAIIDEIHNSDNGPYKKYSNYWKRHRYTKETKPLTVLGTKTGIKRTKLNDLTKWYRKLFFPENIVITIVGNVDCDESFKIVKKYFSDVLNEKTSRDTLKFAELILKPRSVNILIDKKERQTLNSISFPSLSMYTNNYRQRQIAWVIANSLANYRSSILFTRLRKETGLLYSIAADNYFGDYMGGSFEISFETSDNHLAKIYSIIMEEIEDLKNHGFTEKTVKHAIERGNNGLKMGYQSMSNIVWWVTPPLYWFGEVMSMEEAIEIRNTITADEVNEMVRQIFDYKMMNVTARVNMTDTAKELRKLFTGKYL